MKKKIFPKIIYYFFTFSIGLVLAFTLPYILILYCAPNDMETYLAQGSYDKAMELTSGYFNRQAAFAEKFDDGGGIVLFEAAPLVDETQQKMHISYAGFIFGIRDTFKVTGDADNNQTKLIVTDGNGKKHNISLLDYSVDDKTGDKTYVGSIATHEVNGFIYLDLDREDLGALVKLTFVDKDGNVFKDIDLKLNYDGTFFADVAPFVEEYNSNYRSEKLKDLEIELMKKSDRYAKSSYGDTQKHADTKAAIWIVVYFVCIYIIGDFLVGRHFIFRFFRWLYYKTPRGKAKAEKRRTENKEAFGHDYYCQVTMSLNLEELPDFSESVQVRYTNNDGDVTFTLLKQNGYTVTERVRAGKCVNAWIDLNREYAPVDMPENLIVEGYKMDVKIKIIKRKEESV